MDIFSKPIRLYPSSEILARAYQRAIQSRASMYDCLYLVLADDETCPFLTADRRLIQNLAGSANVVHLSEL